MNDPTETSSQMRKGDLREDYSLDPGLSHRFRTEMNHQRLYKDEGGKENQLNLQSSHMLHDFVASCQSLDQKCSFQRNPQNHHHKEQLLTKNSYLSASSFKSTTTEQILSKYEITQIMKQRRQDERKKNQKCKKIAKFFVIILLFPFSVIWLITIWLTNKKKSRVKDEKISEAISQRSYQSRQSESFLLNVCTRCVNSIQFCCINYFCFCLCCECCDECSCCKKCCWVMERCLEWFCENSLMEGLENCVYYCLIKKCQNFCQWFCCHRKSNEKIDTLERLERMNKKQRWRELQIG